MNIFIPNCRQRTRNGLSRERILIPNRSVQREASTKNEGNSNTRSSTKYVPPLYSLLAIQPLRTVVRQIQSTSYVESY